MAGGIDIHSHIASGNVNTARLMLPEMHRGPAPSGADIFLGGSALSTFDNGRLYAEMGFTLVVDPAVNPSDALHAHVELALTPVIDRGLLLVLGNEDFLLGMLRDREGAARRAGLRRGDARRRPGARREGDQCRRRRRLQVERPRLLLRRRGAGLRRQLARHRARPAGGGAGARRPASAARPLQQSRPAGQRRHRAH